MEWPERGNAEEKRGSSSLGESFHGEERDALAALANGCGIPKVERGHGEEESGVVGQTCAGPYGGFLHYSSLKLNKEI